MIAAYVLIGAVGGLLGFSGGLLLGVPFWTAMLLYPAGGATLIGLAAVWRHINGWRALEDYQSVNETESVEGAAFKRIA